MKLVKEVIKRGDLLTIEEKLKIIQRIVALLLEKTGSDYSDVEGIRTFREQARGVAQRAQAVLGITDNAIEARKKDGTWKED